MPQTSSAVMRRSGRKLRREAAKKLDDPDSYAVHGAHARWHGRCFIKDFQ